MAILTVIVSWHYDEPGKETEDLDQQFVEKRPEEGRMPGARTGSRGMAAVMPLLRVLRNAADGSWQWFSTACQRRA